MVEPISASLAVIFGGGALSKPLAKLAETISEQVGLARAPGHIRRIAKAQADARISDALASTEIAEIELRGDIAREGIAARAAARLELQECRRQQNIESTVRQAAESLPEDVSDVPVDADWTPQWVNYCADVSDEEMQSLWARILAGEVAKPGSFSRQTLYVVSIMSKLDAEAFTRFCSFVWLAPDGPTPIMIPRVELDGTYRTEIEFDDMFRLEDLGLVRYSSPAGFSLEVPPGPQTWIYQGGSYRLSSFRPNPTKAMLPIGPALLAKAGREIFGLVKATPIEEYRCKIVQYLRAKGWNLEAGEAPQASDVQIAARQI